MRYFFAIFIAAVLLMAGPAKVATAAIITAPPARTPVLIIPGILGTEMYRGKQLIWPAIPQLLIKPGFLSALAFGIAGQPLDPAIKIGQVIGNQMGFDYTATLVKDFQAQGYEQNKNLFLFPYDWRADITQIADTNLRATVERIMKQTGQTKLTIVAHSEGGLVAKKLVFDKPEIRKYIDKLIFVGVPMLGAPKAAKVLLYGDDLGIKIGEHLGVAEGVIKDLAFNFPPVYEMLPSFESFKQAFGYILNHGHILTADQTKNFLKAAGLNLLLLSRATTFHSAKFDNFDFQASGINAINIVGCRISTLSEVTTPLYESGDGTVPLWSGAYAKGAQTFYAPDVTHDNMLVVDSLRRAIINLVTNNSKAKKLPTDKNVCATHLFDLPQPVQSVVRKEQAAASALDTAWRFISGTVLPKFKIGL